MTNKQTKNKKSRSGRYQLIKKPLGLRTAELIQSLMVIRDSIQSVRAGKLHHFLPLYGQLRLLLTEKSANQKPLLLAVAHEYDYPLLLRYIPLRSEPAEANLAFEWRALMLKVGSTASEEHKSIESFLDSHMLYFAGRQYTPRELISSFANNEGGAHYSPSRTADFTNVVMTISQPIQLNLIEIAEATLELGIRLLQHVSNFEIYNIVCFPPQTFAQENSEPFVFDYKYPTYNNSVSNLRIYCRFDNEQRLLFGFSDMEGSMYETEPLDNVIGKQAFSLLRTYFHITDDLRTRFGIEIGSSSSSTTLNGPVNVRNPINHYQMFLNRSFNNEVAGVKMAIANSSAYGRKLSEEEVREQVLWAGFEVADLSRSCVLFGRSDFAHIPSGTQNMHLSSDKLWSSIGEVLNQQFAS